MFQFIEDGMNSEKSTNLTNIGKINPKILGLYLTRQCNLSCPGCLFLLQKESFHSNMHLPFDDAVKIISFYQKAGIESVSLQSEGEILLYKRYWELIAYCQKIGLTIQSCVTNGILIDKFIPEILTYFKSVSISVDGYDSDSYVERRGGSPEVFKKIISNTKLLRRQSEHSDSPLQIVFNCVLHSNNYQMIPKMIELAESLGIFRIQFRNFHRYDKNDINLSPLYNNKETIQYLTELKKNTYKVEVRWPEVYGQLDSFHCPMLFDTVTVGSDGNFAPCCHIPSHLRYGSFHQEPSNYNNGVLSEFRRTFLNAQIRDELPNQCQECPRLTRSKN